MLIGAIESCSQDQISGWLYSHVASLSGEVVLAFLDGKCIGAGSIDLFRQDLANAGLGDGVLGYRFDINVHDKNDISRVIVTLRGCEAFIIQREARISGPQIKTNPSDYIGGQLPSPSKVEWLKSHNLFSQTDVDLIEALSSFGVAIEPINSGDVDASIKNIFEKVVIGPVLLGCVEFTNTEELADILIHNNLCNDAGIFALVGERRLVSSVQETPIDHSETLLNSPVVGGIEYVLDSRTALILRRWTPFTLRQQLINATVRVYFPLLSEDNKSE